MSGFDVVAGDVAREAERRGFKVRVEGDRVVVEAGEIPLGVEVSRVGDTVVVRLFAGSGMEESIREYAEEVEDVRESVEEILDSAVSLVDYAVRAAERAGFKVKRDTRTAIFDVYEALDNYEESLG